MKRYLLMLAGLCAIQLGAAEAATERTPRPTLFIIGDSTVKNGQRGWGEIIACRYAAFGTNQVNELFDDDHTHTNPAGAELLIGICFLDAPRFRRLSSSKCLRKTRPKALEAVKARPLTV